MKNWIAVVLIMLVLAMGCQEEQKVWGQGELGTKWTEFFGESNGSRLNFIQSQMIEGNKKGLGELLKRVQALEIENPAELAERVRKLEGFTIRRRAEMTEAEIAAGWDRCWTDSNDNRVCEAAIVHHEDDKESPESEVE